MKRSVLFGLFVTASLLASPSFAAEKDQCAVNLQTIEDAQAQIPEEMADQVADSVKQAQADHAKGTKQGIDDCVAETNQTIQDIKNANKGGK
ncbi:hypothetical protein C4E44_23050 [Pseudomonas sp. MWU12-2312b]|jgi:outer membrane murein-binding lipoprotein Lpp|uniref:hypothetical protein n=1 Tax=Pseudomonas moorei TaxID=395599 RepID=UPI000D494B97|nr:hypothetical protein [Pseudomonas moorei]PPA01746.1 hypothetical protein C4E44_23050 [Pseudomonas sp. MWU12-2312b]